MTPTEFLEIGKVLGVPAAVAACLLFFGFIVLLQCIKAARWVGDRTFGEEGVGTKLFERHVQFMDACERNDERHAESLEKLTDSHRVMGEFLETMAKNDREQLSGIHVDVRETKRVAEEIRSRVK